MAEPAMEERVAHLEGRIDGFDSRFDSLERRFDTVERRIDALDTKLDRWREELSGRMERHFQWSMGVTVALWSTIVVALVFRS